MNSDTSSASTQPETIIPAATSCSTYPLLAARKYQATLNGVAAVHKRFSLELGTINTQISQAARLAGSAVHSCASVEPYLDRLSSSISALLGIIAKTHDSIHSGRDSLKSAVDEIHGSVEQIKQRNHQMQDILDISQRIADSIQKISEIAIENKVIAINASITASKASDKVKGFKVIATEITRLSAAMADKVGIIVSQANQVSQRMRMITDKMTASIESTQIALTKIDQAFSLLDQIDQTINQTTGTTNTMLSGSQNLEAILKKLQPSLRDIDSSINRTGQLAAEVRSSIDEQHSLIMSIDQLLPEFLDGSDALATGEAREPKTLRMSELPIQQYDPALATIVREYHYANFTCIRLLRYSTQRHLVPYLAQSWFLDDDGRTWEFSLKPDLSFHDGSPVRAQDVKFSLERVINPAIGSPYANLLSVIEGTERYSAGQTTDVSGIRVVDDHTIRFTLKKPFNFFLSLLAHSFASILKQDRRYSDRPIVRDEVVSAGPFMSIAKPDASTDRLAANPNFVGGRPYLDYIEIHRSVGKVAAAIVSDRIDFAYNQPASIETELKKNGFAGSLQAYTSKYCYGLVVNFMRDNYITRNVEIRRAISRAIAKDRLIQNVLRGKALRADTVLTKEILDCGEINELAFDEAAARDTLTEYKEKEDLSAPISLAVVHNPSMPSLEISAASLVNSLQGLGLTVQLQVLPPEQADVTTYRNFDLVFLRFMPEIDLYSALEPFINPDGGDNYFHYHNPEIFRELQESIGIKDEEERKAYFRGLLRRFSLDVFMIPLFFQQVFCVAKPGVHSVHLSLDEAFFPDLVYLEAEDEVGSHVADPDIAANYSRLNRLVADKSSRVTDTSASLTTKAETMARQILLLAKQSQDSSDLFAKFRAGAQTLGATRTEVMASIEDTIKRAGQSRQAARLIEDGLSQLLEDVAATLKDIQAVRKDVVQMLGIMQQISESNGIIGSVAINAAIISTKAEGNELAKVSKSISELAERNTDNTAVIQEILEEMATSVDTHQAALSHIASSLELADVQASTAGSILEATSPLLTSSEEHSRELEDVAQELDTLILGASKAVQDISKETAGLSARAERLEFGLDMERAVSEILNDVAALNTEICRFSLG